MLIAHEAPKHATVRFGHQAIELAVKLLKPKLTLCGHVHESRIVNIEGLTVVPINGSGNSYAIAKYRNGFFTDLQVKKLAS